MKALLAQAGREFLKAFGAALVILIPGVLAAPDLNQAYALGVAALFAALAAGFKAVQVFVPQLSFAAFVQQPIAAWLDAFTRAALATFLVSVIGILNAPDLATLKAAVVAALVGAVAAGFRALEGFGTKGEEPAPNVGLTP
jgi:hypothetical protein